MFRGKYKIWIQIYIFIGKSRQSGNIARVWIYLFYFYYYEDLFSQLQCKGSSKGLGLTCTSDLLHTKLEVYYLIGGWIY